MVASTVQRAGEAARAVEDLEETLAIFDLKLRHMREVRAAPLLHQTCSPREALQHPLSATSGCISATAWRCVGHSPGQQARS